MPEAVIVSAARSPIGRANKGSLKDLRPDDLAATIVRAALDKVPALDPHTVDDLYLGCGLPGGEQGFNMGRVVNVINGMDDVPGATITRYCASSVQTTRMAFHAIKAGEGDVFVSAGVEMVSSFARGTSDHWPDTRNPLFADALARTAKTAEGGQDWHDPRQDDTVPDIYIAMGQTAENVARLRGLTPPGARRVRRTQPEPRREGDRRRLLGPRDHPGHHARRHRGQRRRRPPAGRHHRGRRGAQAGLPPRRRRDRRQLLPAQRRRRRGRDHVRHPGRRAGPDPVGADRVDRGQRPLARDHGPRARSRRAGGHSPTPA